MTINIDDLLSVAIGILSDLTDRVGVITMADGRALQRREYRSGSQSAWENFVQTNFSRWVTKLFYLPRSSNLHQWTKTPLDRLSLRIQPPWVSIFSSALTSFITTIHIGG